MRIELVFGGGGGAADGRGEGGFSILLRIELVFGAQERDGALYRVGVSVSSCGSSWFLGGWIVWDKRPDLEFQYPLADRVGFWGTMTSSNVMVPVSSFSILLRIELVFGVDLLPRDHNYNICFSILLRIELVFGHHDGETWILFNEFQYPLADRVGFWGPIPGLLALGSGGFSILLRIELVFGGRNSAGCTPVMKCFSILLRIELVFGGCLLHQHDHDPIGFSILLRIELVFGALWLAFAVP